jgi:hypothetical protein
MQLKNIIFWLLRELLGIHFTETENLHRIFVKKKQTDVSV